MTPSCAPALMAEYFKCFAHTWDDETPASEVRFVALDSQTTGLDRTAIGVITIGAAAVMGDEILLEDSFEPMMPIAYNTSAVTVHGPEERIGQRHVFSEGHPSGACDTPPRAARTPAR